MTDVEHVLRDAERPRAFTADEEQRIRSRIGLGGASGTTDAHLIPLRSAHESARPRAAWLLVAAIAIAVAGVAWLTWPIDDVEVTTSDGPASTSVDPLSEICRSEIADLVEQLTLWGGLDNWLQTANEEPDVAETLLEVWEAIAAVPRHRVQADELLARLRPAIAAVPLRGSVAEQLAAGERRAQEMNAALDALQALIADRPPCDAEAVAAAR